MRSIKILPLSGDVFLSDPEIRLMQFIVKYHISHKRTRGGILIDNIKAKKVFVDFKILAEEGEKNVELGVLWEIAGTKKHGKIWRVVAEPKCENILIDERARACIKKLYKKTTH